MAKYEATHPVGTMARLALGLALYSGQRRSDLVKFGPNHVQNGWLVFRQYKGRKTKPVHLEIPIIQELRTLIDVTRSAGTTFISTAFDKPFTYNGFGNRFRKWCDEAGLFHARSTACAKPQHRAWPNLAALNKRLWRLQVIARAKKLYDIRGRHRKSCAPKAL